MARIAVVTATPPFAEGGHLVLARVLVRALREHGHESALVTTPSNRWGQQARAYLATYLTDVGLTGHAQKIDQVITLRFPSYAVRHENHVCWLNHTMREYYDLWHVIRPGMSWRALIKETARRKAIHATDTYLFKHNVSKMFVLSKNVQSRVTRWNGVASEVLYPPAPHRNYRCEGYDDFLFVYSRLAPLKRIGLIIDALATGAAAGVRCVIAGEGEQQQELAARIRLHALEHRVTMVGHISDDQLTDYLARCRAVCFVPKDEDFGMVTLEAFASGKAVITVTDSGAPTELVTPGVYGDVAEPDPGSLGLAIGTLMNDAAGAERMGQAAAARAAEINWTTTVERLVQR